MKERELLNELLNAIKAAKAAERSEGRPGSGFSTAAPTREHMARVGAAWARVHAAIDAAEADITTQHEPELCGNCWYSRTRDGRGSSLFCFRYPPPVRTVVRGSDGEVDYGEWCGEWKAKRDER